MIDIISIAWARGVAIAKHYSLFLTAVLCLVVGVTDVRAGVDHRLMQQLMQKRYGDTGMQRLQAWRELLNDATALPLPQQLEAVNTFFNRHIFYMEDSQLWGQHDYWASPLETLGVGAGDCEDYSIAKYMTLKLLGVPKNKLRLIYVNARVGASNSSTSQAHMVLGYYENLTADPLILDNLTSQLVPGSHRDDLKPVFSFNSQGLWTGNSTVSVADPTARLSRWRNVLQRMGKEGFR
jgi:predicted transglutaminase-like cysteine proteinase